VEPLHLLLARAQLEVAERVLDGEAQPLRRRHVGRVGGVGLDGPPRGLAAVDELEQRLGQR